MSKSAQQSKEEIYGRRCVEHKQQKSLELPTERRYLFVVKCCHPQTSADDIGIWLELVFRARLQEPKEVLYNRGCCTVALEVDEWLATTGHAGDVCGLLCIINKVTSIQA